MSGTLVGLVGRGIGPSLTPALHEREADRLGLRYLYRRIDLDELGLPAEAIGDLLAAVRLAGYDGLNVTYPCKQLVLGHLDELSEEAAAVGAVNTVVLTGGRAVGYNTDVTGFARAMEAGLADVTLGEVVLLGAGGAGAACAYALLGLGVRMIRIVDTDAARAIALAERLGSARAVAESSPRAALASADGLVHATPTGMRSHPGLPLPAGLLAPRLWVADLVYRPLRTALTCAAAERGCRVLDGGRMAVFQAAHSFGLFTGIKPDADRMLRDFTTLVPEEVPCPAP